MRDDHGFDRRASVAQLQPERLFEAVKIDAPACGFRKAPPIATMREGRMEPPEAVGVR